MVCDITAVFNTMMTGNLMVMLTKLACWPMKRE